MTPPAPPTLARQHARWLIAAFLGVELLVAAALTRGVLWPLALRSADDLAGLMVLSAQTWSELPPATRPAFEVALRQQHDLALRADLPDPVHTGWSPPFFYLLEAALGQRLGQPTPLWHEVTADEDWFWAALPTGSGALVVGVAGSRIDSRPMLALALALVAALAGGVGLAALLARRLSRPLAQLEAATAVVAQGGLPPPLPPTGPREVAALSERFNAMAQQVQALLNTRTTLLAGISHDLRTPLARLRLSLELLRLQPSADLLERMEGDLSAMEQLITDGLALARGLRPEATESVEMLYFLERITGEIPGLEAQNIQIRVDCDPGPAQVPPNALRRALGNLLVNAARYGCPPAAGGGACTIELLGRCRQGRWRVGVLDRGPGIPAQQQAAVLEPFVRLETSRSPKTGGAGLGLSIVRELARAQGWQLRLDNRDGGGLQVWLDLGPGPGEAASACPTSPG